MSNSNKFSSIVVALISVFMALIMGSIILIISGINPLSLFESIFQSINKNFDGWITISSMLIFTGLAIGFSYKGGLFNIGAEGQFIIASLATAIFAVNSNMPNQIIPLVGLIVGFVAGALWALLPGILKATYGISEVVITIMLNWISMYTFDYIVQTYFHQATNTQQTPIIEPSKLLVIHEMNYAIIIAFFVAFIYWFILEKTIFGFEVKAIGNSKDIAQYTGISAKSRIVQTMMISGGFAGLAGATYALSYGYLSTISGNFANYGFDGIAVALLGNLTAVGTIVSSFLMGALRNAEASFGINRIPNEISDIIIALIILFSVIGPLIYKKLQKRGV